jgi:hypothetical protein
MNEYIQIYKHMHIHLYVHVCVYIYIHVLLCMHFIFAPAPPATTGTQIEEQCSFNSPGLVGMSGRDLFTYDAWAHPFPRSLGAPWGKRCRSAKSIKIHHRSRSFSYGKHWFSTSMLVIRAIMVSYNRLMWIMWIRLSIWPQISPIHHMPASVPADVLFVGWWTPSPWYFLH